jgi:hypothetical protein
VTTPNQVLCASPDVDPAALAAYVENRGPLPEGAYLEDEETFFARGRVEGCTCGMISCVCKKIAFHRAHCEYRKALVTPVAIECEHGVDVCPKCDSCTCLGDQAGDLWAMAAWDRTLKGSRGP